MKRAVFSSVQNFAQTLVQNPALFSIPAFMPLKSLIDKVVNNDKGCSKCNANKNKIYTEYKGLFESSVSSLQDADRANIKRILNVDKVCYYTRGKNSVLELNCF